MESNGSIEITTKKPKLTKRSNLVNFTVAGPLIGGGREHLILNVLMAFTDVENVWYELFYAAKGCIVKNRNVWINL